MYREIAIMYLSSPFHLSHHCNPGAGRTCNPAECNDRCHIQTPARRIPGQRPLPKGECKICLLLKSSIGFITMNEQVG